MKYIVFASFISLVLSTFVAANSAYDSAPSATANNQVYDSLYFQQYLVSNALDMIEQIPGFTFDEGSQARGFGANASNVLINGKRPVSKSGGTRAALLRIPQGQVAYIEIIHGTISAAEAAGQVVIANVITNTSSVSGSIKASTEYSNEKLHPSWHTAVSAPVKEWQLAFTIQVGENPELRRSELVNIPASNTQPLFSAETLDQVSKWRNINGEGQHKLAGGDFTVNMLIGLDKWFGNTTRQTMLQDTPDDHLSLIQRYKENISELGLSWDRHFSHWKFGVLGIGQIKRSLFTADSSFTTSNMLSPDDTLYREERTHREFIARTTLAYTTSTQWKPEFGLEIAKNQLNATSMFGVISTTNLPNTYDSIAAEEIRTELFTKVAYQATPLFSVESGATFEYSRITASADRDTGNNYFYFKPHIAVTSIRSNNHRTSIKLEHKVGQLNLHNFASTFDASDDVQTIGNTQLEPEKYTMLDLSYDWSFSEQGNLNISALHHWRKDVLEQILLSEPDDSLPYFGLGNAGNARVWGASIKLDLPLEKLWPGSTLHLAYDYRNSKYYDPMVSHSRIVTDSVPRSFSLNFKQPFFNSKALWGASYKSKTRSTAFLGNEIHTIYHDKVYGVFIESRLRDAMKISFEMNGINGTRVERVRAIYAPHRGESLLETELAKRYVRPELILSFQADF